MDCYNVFGYKGVAFWKHLVEETDERHKLANNAHVFSRCRNFLTSRAVRKRMT